MSKLTPELMAAWENAHVVPWLNSSDLKPFYPDQHEVYDWKNDPPESIRFQIQNWTATDSSWYPLEITFVDRTNTPGLPLRIKAGILQNTIQILEFEIYNLTIAKRTKNGIEFLSPANRIQLKEIDFDTPIEAHQGFHRLWTLFIIIYLPQLMNGTYRFKK